MIRYNRQSPDHLQRLRPSWVLLATTLVVTVWLAACGRSSENSASEQDNDDREHTAGAADASASGAAQQDEPSAASPSDPDHDNTDAEGANAEAPDTENPDRATEAPGTPAAEANAAAGGPADRQRARRDGEQPAEGNEGPAEAEPELTREALLLSTRPVPPPRVDDLLRADDLVELTGFTRMLEPSVLSGAPNSPERGSLVLTHRRGFGASIEYRLYHDRVELLEDLGALRVSTPGAGQAPQLEGLRNAFVADAFGVRSITFATEPPLQLLTIACSSEICDETQLNELAQRALSRLHGAN